MGLTTITSTATANLDGSTGLLDVVVNGGFIGGGANVQGSGTAFASFAETVVATGETGSGLLIAKFSGFGAPYASGSLPPSPGLSVVLGANTLSLSLPLASSSFSYGAPFTFGSPLLFQASVSTSAQVPLLMRNTAASAGNEGRVNFLGFSLADATGAPLAGTVTPTPEPGFMGCAGIVLLGLGMVARRKR